MTSEDQIDQLLRRHFRDATNSSRDEADAAARVLAALQSPLPPQRRAWRRWPSVLLDWQFAPAWPRVAALAGCAALGFAIGAAASLPSQDSSAQRGDFQLAALAEPEAMT